MKKCSEIYGLQSSYLTLRRSGDFYQAFNHDAVTIGPVLGLTICGRDGRDKQGKPISPSCGFPYHQLDAYVAKLRAGGHVVQVLDTDGKRID